MIDPVSSRWLPDDPELRPFFNGVDQFVTRHVSLGSSITYQQRKVILDPCVGYIELYPWEVTLIDTHIFQRLRKITQLGLAYLVFPTLRYSRFEHTLGVLGRLDQVLKRLKEKHKQYDLVSHPLSKVNRLIDQNETTLRLAALFHDIGHCLFSHLSENVIAKLGGNEDVGVGDPEYYPSSKTIVEKFESKLKKRLGFAEILSLTIMGSDAFVKILSRGQFKKEISDSNGSIASEETISELLYRAANWIAGIPIQSEPQAVFLAQLISSGLDADKLDYMSREEHFSGIKIEMDLERILNKIGVQNVKNRALQKGLEKYSRYIKDSKEEYLVLSIERGGQFAYEEFCVARLALYEKIYLHKKVRAAEQYLGSLLSLLAKDQKEFEQAHNWLYLPESVIERQTRVDILSSEKITKEITLFGEEIREIKAVKRESKLDFSSIEKREIPHRAFAFGPANATYDNEYYNLLDSAKTKDDIEREIRKLPSVRFWQSLLGETGDEGMASRTLLMDKIEREALSLTKDLLDHGITTKNMKRADLMTLQESIQLGSFRQQLIIDVPQYNRVALNFDTLHFEESSFQSVRWTIPIHRIAYYYQLHRILAFVYFEKKYCPLICLACSKVVLEFLGGNANDRQVYEQKGYISESVYSDFDSIKRLLLKRNSSYFENMPELLPQTDTLNNEHARDIINRIVSELNKYHRTKFGSEIRHQDVINYLHQFPEDKQEFVLEVLRSIRVVHELEMEKLLEDISVGTKAKRSAVIPLGAAFSSGPSIVKHLQTVLKKQEIECLPPSDPAVLDCDHLIFVDDNTNSGRQALNIIAKWCNVDEKELKQKKIFTDVAKNSDAKFISAELANKLKSANLSITLCFITGTADAEEFLKKHLNEICGVKGHITIKTLFYIDDSTKMLSDDNRPPINSVFFEPKDEFLKYKSDIPIRRASDATQFLRMVGAQLVANRPICVSGEKPEAHALGYCNRESTVIFMNSVPTATITALWCWGRYKLNEKDDSESEKNWIPLIPRSRISYRN